MSSTTRHILRATTLVAVCTLAVKVLGAGKDLVLAREFGVSPTLDGFLLAYLIPAFLINSLSGSLQAAFIPEYMRVRAAQGEEAGWKLAAATATLLLCGLGAASLLVTPLSITLLPLFMGNLPAETLRESQFMVVMIAPIIVFNGVMFYWAGILNSHHRFGKAALIPGVTPLFVVAAALSLSNRLGIYSVPLGLLVGGMLEVVLVAVAVRGLGGRLFTRPLFRAEQKSMLFQFGAAVLSNVLIGSTLVVEQSVAASLGSGAVSAQSFGSKAPLVIATMLAMTVATVALPDLSRMVAARDWKGIEHRVRAYLAFALLLAIPAMAVLMSFSTEITRVFFERGAFGSDDTKLVARVQFYYALHIPFFGASMVFVRTLWAMKANQLLALSSGLSLIASIPLNLVLGERMGVAGIGLASSLMHVLASLVLFVAMRYRLSALRSGSGSASLPDAARQPGGP